MMDGSGHDRGATHPLWTFLTALSGVTDELERARLTATGLPALVPCSVSGMALVDGAQTRWQLVLQKDGQDVAGHLVEDVLADLPGSSTKRCASPRSW